VGADNRAEVLAGSVRPWAGRPGRLVATAPPGRGRPARRPKRVWRGVGPGPSPRRGRPPLRAWARC